MLLNHFVRSYESSLCTRHALLLPRSCDHHPWPVYSRQGLGPPDVLAVSEKSVVYQRYRRDLLRNRIWGKISLVREITS